MKQILNPKMQNEKVTFIEDSSSEENMDNEEDSSSQQHYIQEDHLVSLEPVQGGHKDLEGNNTFITEHGLASRISSVQEAMKDKQEDDFIFKKLANAMVVKPRFYNAWRGTHGLKGSKH